MLRNNVIFYNDANQCKKNDKTVVAIIMHKSVKWCNYLKYFVKPPAATPLNTCVVPDIPAAPILCNVATWKKKIKLNEEIRL